MTTLSVARQKWKEIIGKYQKIRPTRTAILGDGRGTAEANLVVPGRPDYVFARDTIRDANFFQVLNNGAVQPAFNLPVVIGLPVPGEKVEEPQIIGIHYAGLGSIPSSTIPKVGPHHQQHEFRGGDDILLDPRQFLAGLVHPTDPTSMKVQVESFIYFWDTWRRWEISQSKDLTEYKPSSGYVLWVLIALDPETGGLVYRPGVPFTTGSQEVIYGTFTPIPAPAGNELPLGYIRLLSTTTAIDWTETADNIGDARLWVNPPMLNILDRLRQLEGATGNPPSLATMGVAQYSVDDDITGTGVANRVAYWSGATTLTNSSALTFDGIGSVLLGSATAGATIVSALEIASPVAITTTFGLALWVTSTITAHAISDEPQGVQIWPIFAKGTFTNLHAAGIVVGAGSPTGSGTIADYATARLVEDTFATANIGLLIGTHPGGSTNYAAYLNSANAVYLGTGMVTIAGGLNVGSATGAGTGEMKGSSVIRAGSGSIGYVQLVAGAASQAGHLDIHNGSGTRLGYIGYDNAELTYAAESGARHMFTGGDVLPVGGGTYNLGNATDYWADVSYKTLTDRGCLGWFDIGVEMLDGSIVSDVEALTLIQKHPTLKTVYGTPRLDYSTMPKVVYKPANGKGEDGAELTALVSIMLGAIKELNTRISELENKWATFLI